MSDRARVVQGPRRLSACRGVGVDLVWPRRDGIQHRIDGRLVDVAFYRCPVCSEEISGEAVVDETWADRVTEHKWTHCNCGASPSDLIHRRWCAAVQNTGDSPK